MLWMRMWLLFCVVCVCVYRHDLALTTTPNPTKHARYVAVGIDRGGKEVFREARLPNCYLHLAWARRSYLDQRSPVSVWWDYALVREDLQGNRGNLFGMNASSAALIKAFIELDPYQARGMK